MALMTDELSNLRSENEILKSKFVDQKSEITQTDESACPRTPINQNLFPCCNQVAAFQEQKLVVAQQASYERSNFCRIQGVHSDDQSFSRKSANPSKIPLPLSSTESACEAELYFDIQLPRSELSLLNYCDQIKKEKCDLSRKVGDYEQIIDDLSARLAEQTNENTELVGNLKRLHNELENFQRIDYDSVKIEAIKSTLLNFLRRAID
uniref:Uncharacterized protein n=1 Tax=Romanomermis culicivorax TaxID=13658 RepID=A0A915JTF5_ROMCU